MILQNKNNFYLIGALTSKPYAFLARSWELKIYESIDIYDNLGSNIRFDVNNLKILRILPKVNKNLNENWITDKVRFCYDGLQKQRISYPLIRENNKLIPTTWLEALKNFKALSQESYIESFCGVMVDLETMYIFKEFLNKLGYWSFKVQNFNNFVSTNLRESYNNLNFLFKNLKKINNLFIFGLNIRLENPIFNIKLRKHVLHHNLKIYNFGFSSNLTYIVSNFGNNSFSFKNFFEGRSLLCLKFLKTNLNYLLLGYNLCYRQDLNFFKNFLSFFSNSFKNVIGNFFYQGANSFGSLELGHDQHILTNQINRKNKLLYLLDIDDIFFKKDMYDSVIYQGHHGSLNIYFSDLVFAGVTPYEKNGLYINLFGMIQKSTVILKSKYKVKNDWKIITALSYYSNLTVPLLYLGHNDILAKINKIISLNLPVYNNSFLNNNYLWSSVLNNSLILNFMGNYYLTNIISRSSVIMSLCSTRFKLINFY